jgi:hypothetical protein
MVGSLAHRPVELDTVNYLIVETSGVSDPQRVIQTMDKTFGKMYRARLDSVVTVVDVDAMLGSEGRDRESGGTGAPVLSVAAGDISHVPFTCVWCSHSSHELRAPISTLLCSEMFDD